MKSVLTFLIIPLLFFSTIGNVHATFEKEGTKGDNDRCNEWASNSMYEYLYIRICEYESGGSGYYQFKNNYDKAVRFSFKIFHKNGEVTSGSTNVSSGETHRASCFNCAVKNGGGNKSYEIDKVYFEGEKGYW